MSVNQHVKIGCTCPSRIPEVLTLYNVSCTASSKEIYFIIQCGSYRFLIQDLPKVFDKRKKAIFYLAILGNLQT